jgi:hypothetical protein
VSRWLCWLVKANAPELRLVHDLLDSWSGIGLVVVVVGMAHQGFTVSLGEHGVGRSIAVFFVDAETTKTE